MHNGLAGLETGFLGVHTILSVVRGRRRDWTQGRLYCCFSLLIDYVAVRTLEVGSFFWILKHPVTRQVADDLPYRRIAEEVCHWRVAWCKAKRQKKGERVILIWL